MENTVIQSQNKTAILLMKVCKRYNAIVINNCLYVDKEQIKEVKLFLDRKENKDVEIPEIEIVYWSSKNLTDIFSKVSTGRMQSKVPNISNTPKGVSEGTFDANSIMLEMDNKVMQKRWEKFNNTETKGVSESTLDANSIIDMQAQVERVKQKMLNFGNNYSDKNLKNLSSFLGLEIKAATNKTNKISETLKSDTAGYELKELPVAGTLKGKRLYAYVSLTKVEL